MGLPDSTNFLFRNLHPHLFIGTASDRYKGWEGQVYTAGLYAGKESRRSKKVGGERFVEELFPVESVEEYFRHFSVLELDFTFYRPLLDNKGAPTQTFELLSRYGNYLKEGRLILKVPQIISAKKLRRKDGYIANDNYLDPEIFVRQFYRPALELLSDRLDGLVFEQEYQLKMERSSPRELASGLDAFLGSIPKDTRYHFELRTGAYLSPQIFDVLEKHGVGQVLSHWTWLPSLSDQFELSGKRILNCGRKFIVRLMTPRGVKYEEAYARAYPFDALVSSMLDTQMVSETVKLIREITHRKADIYVIINNRAGGNAPLIARRVAQEFESLRKRPANICFRKNLEKKK
ncbi:MAG: DUF72 domain-containing protein [Thermodesulfobacteriota bacterium]|nr:DUF72 domain-containing protein [Thermodesulfobacteriota bacterium]